MRTLLPLLICVALFGCEGVVGELGVEGAGAPPPVPPLLPVGKPAVTTFSCTPSSGPASLKSLCTIAAAHGDQKPVTCSLTVSDGRAPLLDAAACPAELSVVFDAPGTFTLTLEVRDAIGQRAEAKQTIVVAEKPNAVPVIASFAATPAAGTVPLSTSFTWSVSDPDGDGLSCSIDVGNDGSVEYPMLDCASASRAHTLTMAQVAEVLFVVRDARGLAAQSVITLTARAPVGDVRISKVEWAQSVVLETLRLVQGKPALFRAHVLGDKAGLANVVVEAEGFNASGTSLGKLSLVGPAAPPVAVVPADLKQQWTATVPAAWVEVGLEIRLKLDPLDALPETDESNNALVVKPLVGKGNIVQLTSVPVVHQGNTGAPKDIQAIMTALWPVKQIANTNRAPYTFSGTLQAGNTAAWGDLLQDIAGVRQADGSNRNYYGWVKVGYGSGIAGIGYIGQEAATGRDDSLDTAAHELGHNFGRNHAPCGGVAGADANFPYAGGKIGSWGYNAASKALVNPANVADLMSYCDPSWVSDYNYKAVQTRLETQAFVPPQAPSLFVPVVLVAGSIRGDDVSLRPVQRLVAAKSVVADGAWAVRLVTADGSPTLHPFTPDEVADADDGLMHFTLTLPDPGSLRAIEVLHGAKVIKRTLASAMAPTAATLAVEANRVRLQWEAPATAAIAHLAEDGTRTTLGLWLTGGDVLIPTEGLPAGHFEVSVSDGLNAVRTVR